MGFFFYALKREYGFVTGFLTNSVSCSSKSEKDAIMEAMYRGTKRNVESEPDPKNA